jgi:hypothetical protein
LTTVGEQPEFDVFISHNSEERIAVAELCERLRDEGKLRPWRDHDSIRPGEDWALAIEKALASCPACAVVFGPRGWSAYHFREVLLALQSRATRPGFRIIPVMLPGALDADLHRIPDAGEKQAIEKLKSLQWIDFRRGGLEDDEAFIKLMAGIGGRALPAEELGVLSPYRVNKDARVWERKNRSRLYLYSGGHLKEAQRLAQQQRDALTDLALAFLVASDARMRRTRKIRRVGSASAIAAAVLVYFIGQFIVDSGYRRQLMASNLPAGIYRAPALEALTVADPLSRLDWIRPPLKSLEISINEDGTPDSFPPFLTELKISGQADGRSARYDVDVRGFPPELSSLGLNRVSLQSPDQFPHLQRLKALTLREVFLARSRSMEFPPKLESLDTDFDSRPRDMHSLNALRYLTITGTEFNTVDARELPPSLVSLSVEGAALANPEAMSSLGLQEIHTTNLDVLARLPKSVTRLSLTPRNWDSTRFAALQNTRIEKLVLDVPAPKALEPKHAFHMAWLPPTIHELSLNNVAVIHDEPPGSLSMLAKLSLGGLLVDLHGVAASVHDLSIEDCITTDDLRLLPTDLRRLAITCLSEFPRVVRYLRRFRALQSFVGLELSDDIDFTGLPQPLKELAIGATSSADPGSINKLAELTDLSLDFRPGTGSSDVPGGVDENLTIVDVKELPRSLTKLRVTNLRLAHAEALASFDGLLELTVDRYNRGVVGIPKSLRKLVIKGEVGSNEFRKMVGF